MMNGRLRWLALVGVLVLAVESAGQARGPQPAHFSGLINDHTIATAGSWELHGVWTLDLQGNSGRGDFSAALTMERSDFWFLTTPTSDPNNPAVRNPHTHHVAVADGVVTSIPNGFRMTGPATITANGATPPFGTASTLQVDVTGNSLVAYSNVALTFSGDAVMHFGPDALAGVVSAWK